MGILISFRYGVLSRLSTTSSEFEVLTKRNAVLQLACFCLFPASVAGSAVTKKLARRTGNGALAELEHATWTAELWIQFVCACTVVH